MLPGPRNHHGSQHLLLKQTLPVLGEAGALDNAVLMCTIRWVCGGHVDSQNEGFGAIWGSQVVATFQGH